MTHMISSRAARRGKISEALASAAGFLFLGLAAATFAPAASAQVLGSQPYVPQPDPAIERMSRRVDQLEADLRKANSRADQIGLELSQARKAAEDATSRALAGEKTITALTARVEALERIASPPSLAEAGNVATQPAQGTINLVQGGPAAAAEGRLDPASLPTDEAELLKKANELLVDGQVVGAQQAALVFLDRFPKSKKAGEAQYTIGEALMIQKSYADAAEAYSTLITKYPASEQAPIGLVKLSRAFRLLNKKPQACSALALLPKNYPKAGDMVKNLAATEKSRAGC